MSDNARPKSGGDKLRADEINQDLPVQGTGGETISGATTPAPVYVDDSDGELYECDAGDTDKLNFVGFVVDDTSDGNSATLQKDGVVSGFSGLTPGKDYFVQDGGGIGTTPGSNFVKVGIALSSTTLLITNKEKMVMGYDSFSALGDGTPDTNIQTIGFRPKLILFQFKINVDGYYTDIYKIVGSGQCDGALNQHSSSYGADNDGVITSNDTASIGKAVIGDDGVSNTITLILSVSAISDTGFSIAFTATQSGGSARTHTATVSYTAIG